MPIQTLLKTTAPVPVPFFMDVPGGRLFAVHHRPADATELRGNVLCVPAFNEELNRCRSMVTFQARALAQQGFGVLVVDLIGTGDSTGEYRDATWAGWLDNLRAAVAWLERQPGGCTLLWGIRLGAILAAEIHAEMGKQGKAPGLMFWQPVLDGKQHFTQFLRIRIAAEMNLVGIEKQTTTTMREQLAQGNTIEVAGYEICPALGQALDKAKLSAVPPAAGTPLFWLEQTIPGASDVAPPSRSLIDKWLAAGLKPDVQSFEGPAFWQVHERVAAPDVLLRTAEWIKQQYPHHD